MKKIYKSLAAVACAFIANAAFGQNLVVTADGNPVANGDVIDLPYEFFIEDFPEFGFTYYKAIWDPHLEVSTTSGSAQLTVTLTSIDATGFQLCWNGLCKAPTLGDSVSSTDPIGTTPEDLQIHKEEYLDSANAVPSAGGTVKVKLQSDSESMEITINAIVSEKNGVSENWVDDSLPTVYFTLEGIQVDNPTKGIYVARKGSKAKLVYKK